MSQLARFAFCLSVIAFCLRAVASEPDFSSVEDAIAQLYPGESLLSSDPGDLNGDGRPEVAATLRVEVEPELPLRVVVFTTNEKGRLEKWTQTKPVAECRHSTSIAIERQSLVLGCVHWLGIHGGTNSSEQLRFIYRRGTLIEAGEDHEFIEDMNGPKESTKTVSRNFLTGEILETSNGKRTSKRSDATIKSEAIPLSSWEGW